MGCYRWLGETTNGVWTVGGILLGKVSRETFVKGGNMNTRVEALVNEARILTPEERVALLDALNELVSPPTRHGRRPGQGNARTV